MIGVLALQGDFLKHKDILDQIGVESLFVKNEEELFKTKALIIPGGESTTLSHLMDIFSMRKAICRYAELNSVFGTCAGMIMLSTSNLNEKVKTLDIMDFSVSRNSWGTQKDSFEKKINFKNFNLGILNAVFIRGPKVVSTGRAIKKMDYYKNEIVLLEDEKHLACSFHPEIENDLSLHKYFLEKSRYE